LKWWHWGLLLSVAWVVFLAGVALVVGLAFTSDDPRRDARLGETVGMIGGVLWVLGTGLIWCGVALPRILESRRREPQRDRW
jgi:hypothetical protein